MSGILIIDDDETYGRDLQCQLTGELRASRPDVAWKVEYSNVDVSESELFAKIGRAAVILSDVYKPDAITGVAMLKQFKEVNSELRVYCLVGGNANSEVYTKAQEDGLINGYVRKGRGFKALLPELQSILADVQITNQNQLRVQEADLVDAQRAAVNAWMNLGPRENENIVGVGIGNRTRDGEIVSLDPVIVFFVKTPEGLACLPRECRGISTDWVEAGEVSLANEWTYEDRTSPVRPVTAGVSIASMAHQDRPGTLGCFVSKDRRRYLLTCAHVLNPSGTLLPGAAVVQPGGLETVDHGHTIAMLADHDASENCDAVLALINEGMEIDPAVIGIGALQSHPADPVRNACVAKMGRATGLTLGVVTQTPFTARIPFPSGPRLLNSFVVSSLAGEKFRFSRAGDSGSVVCDPNSRTAFGMVVAFLPRIGATIVQPLTTVATRLGFEHIL